MKIFWNALIFGIAVQLTTWVFWAFGVFGDVISYPVPVTNITTLYGPTGIFNITAFGTMVGIGGAAVIGVAGILLRQGTYALYAMTLWGIGQFFPIVSGFFLAIPNTMSALLPAVTNPNPTLFPVNPIMVVVSVIFAFGAFTFMFGLVFNRELT